ncbi:MAG TPA: helix-turn-helix domain-containing protein [Patescibacteria group bacterium]|nr:helix-turn-helix domain-containing protein [Patescibacteria group bacterium]
MTSRHDPSADALWNARRIRVGVGTDIRDGRLNAGLSQQSAGASVGMSHAQFGRIERAEVDRPTIEQLSLACAAVGLKLVVRAYPDCEPARDAAQNALLDRLRAKAPAATPWRSEVPLPIVGDRRAWDAVVTLSRQDVAIEAESRLRDIQAMKRKIALKQRDGGIERVILLVNDTAANRRTLRAVREELRDRFPLDSRDVLRAIRQGLAPDKSGLVIL